MPEFPEYFTSHQGSSSSSSRPKSPKPSQSTFRRLASCLFTCGSSHTEAVGKVTEFSTSTLSSKRPCAPPTDEEIKMLQRMLRQHSPTPSSDNDEDVQSYLSPHTPIYQHNGPGRPPLYPQPPKHTSEDSLIVPLPRPISQLTSRESSSSWDATHFAPQSLIGLLLPITQRIVEQDIQLDAPLSSRLAQLQTDLKNYVTWFDMTKESQDVFDRLTTESEFQRLKEEITQFEKDASHQASYTPPSQMQADAEALQQQLKNLQEQRLVSRLVVKAKREENQRELAELRKKFQELQEQSDLKPGEGRSSHIPAETCSASTVSKHSSVPHAPVHQSESTQRSKAEIQKAIQKTLLDSSKKVLSQLKDLQELNKRLQTLQPDNSKLASPIQDALTKLNAITDATNLNEHDAGDLLSQIETLEKEAATLEKKMQRDIKSALLKKTVPLTQQMKTLRSMVTKLEETHDCAKTYSKLTTTVNTILNTLEKTLSPENIDSLITLLTTASTTCENAIKTAQAIKPTKLTSE